jgi:hypothetical protein
MISAITGLVTRGCSVCLHGQATGRINIGFLIGKGGWAAIRWHVDVVLKVITPLAHPPELFTDTVLFEKSGS